MPLPLPTICLLAVGRGSTSAEKWFSFESWASTKRPLTAQAEIIHALLSLPGWPEPVLYGDDCEPFYEEGEEYEEW